MGPKYISAWENFKTSVWQNVSAAAASGEAQLNDVVWSGPDGSVVIASDPAELGEDYAEYTDAGLVEEYLHDG